MQPIPQPHGDALERRRGEPLDVVQETMVECVARLGHRSIDVVEMEKDAGRGTGSPSMVTRARNEWPCTREFG